MIVSTFYRDVHVDRPRFVIFIFHGNFRPSASMQFWHGINSAVPTFSLIFIISLIFFLYVFVLLCCAHLTFTAAVKRKMFRRMKGSAPLVGGAWPTRPISDATFKWKTKWEKCKWNFHQLWTADEFHHKSDEFNEIFDLNFKCNSINF